MTSDQPARVRWLGHASVMIELAGVRVLTDPALTPRLAHLRRHHRVDVATLERPDLVLISHVHLDHLHIPSLRLFDADVAMIVPAGAAALPASQGLRPRPRDARRRHHHVRAAHHRDRAGGPPRPVAGRTAASRPTPSATWCAPGTPACTSPATPTCSRRWARSARSTWRSCRSGVGAAPSARATSTPSGRPAPSSWCARSSWCRCTGAPTPPSACADPTWLDTPVHRFTDELTTAGAADRLRVLAPGSDLLLPAHARPMRPELKRP